MNVMEDMMDEKSFRDYYREQSPIPIYIIFGLFILSNMLLVINFTEPVAETVNSVRLVINAAVIVLGPMYFCFQLLLWRRNVLNWIVTLAIISGVFLGWNYLGHTEEIFFTAASFVLVLLVNGTDYRIILKMY